MQVPERVIQRIIHWADPEVRVPELGPCLISRYSVGSHGYAQIGWQEDGVRFMGTAPRVLWIGLNGPIERDMTVDHRCHVRTCVEIAHLRLLPNAANAADNGQVPTNPDSDRVCKVGHVMAVGQVNGKPMHYCRDCQNERRRARRALGKKN